MANKPNNPSLWSRAKSMAKKKFDVYPSAYANGWAAKWYKSKGGTWRKAQLGAYLKKGGTIAKTTKGPGANYRPTKEGAGMTQKGVEAYRRANPGSKLKTAVTGKVKPGSLAAKRRKSYCARSLGQLKKSSQKTQNDPNSRIRQARRRWKC
jgi:hypothetical protein